MTMFEAARDLDNGIYRLYWKEGGFSLAAVGRDSAGRVWFAPVNWIRVPCMQWTLVDRAEKIPAGLPNRES